MDGTRLTADERRALDECLLVEGVVAFFRYYETWWIIWRTMRLGPIRNEIARKDDSNSDWSLFQGLLKYQPMKAQGWILFGFIYLGFLMVHLVIAGSAEGAFVYYDSYEYYRHGFLSLTDSRFWTSGRPPISLIFYKLFGGYEIESHLAGSRWFRWRVLRGRIR